MKKFKKKIRKIFISLLLFLYLRASSVKAQLPYADGFAPIYVYRFRYLKRETYSREATGLSTHLQQNPNDAKIPRGNKKQYDHSIPEHGCVMEDAQVRRKFKHATDFGVEGNANRKNFELFKDKLADHMKNPSTIIKKGPYKKTIEVTRYFNEGTDLNVMIRQNDNTFISG